jgi:hypothetical protein
MLPTELFAQQSKEDVMRGFVLLLLGLPFTAAAVEQVMPPSTDANYCGAVQRVLAATDVSSDNTVFTDMPSYRHSKPMIQPSPPIRW